MVAVDIEGLHRGKDWGEDAKYFKPERWETKPNNPYLPFGYRPFTCPAKDKFGPKMIGLLVATMVEGFQREKKDTEIWEIQEEGDEIAGSDPLSLEREAFSSLRVDRIQKA